MTAPCDHRLRVSVIVGLGAVRATKTMLNLRFGGAVVYVTVSSL